MKRTMYFVLLIAVLVAMVLVACAKPAATPTTTKTTPLPTTTAATTPAPASPTTTAEVKPIKLVFYSYHAPDYAYGKYYPKAMVDEIVQRSAGRLQIDISWSAALGPFPQAYTIITNGLADFGVAALANTPGRFPLSELGDLPLNGSRPSLIDSLQALREKGYFDQEFSGVVLLSFNNQSTTELIFKKAKPMKLEDFNGLKLRAAGGPPMQEYIKGLGAVPVTVAITETYGALEKGIIDGAAIGAFSAQGQKLSELSKYFLRLPLYNPTNALLFNKDKWATIPPDLQAMIREVALKHRLGMYQGAKETDDGSVEKMVAAGVESYKLPDAEMQRARRVATSIWEKWVAGYADKGAKKAMDEFISEMKKRGETLPYP